jgi:hypothetical protein
MAPTLITAEDREYLQKLIPMDCEVLNIIIHDNLTISFTLKVEHMQPKYWYGWTQLMDNCITIFRPVGGIWRDVIFNIEELDFERAEQRI